MALLPSRTRFFPVPRVKLYPCIPPCIKLEYLTMTRSEILLAIALCAETAFGFPQGAVAKRSNVAFDPKAQYVSNMGIHKFVPPNFAAGDRRGPCPGISEILRR